MPAQSIDRLLGGSGLSPDDLARRLGQAMAPGTDLADLFVEQRLAETWTLNQGRIEGGSFDLGGGFGLRAVSGERTAFANASMLTPAALDTAVLAVRGMDGAGATTIAVPLSRAPETAVAPFYAGLDPSALWDASRKTALLAAVDAHARQADPRIVNVRASLALERQIVLVLREDGRMIADDRPMVQLAVQVQAESNGRREGGSHAIGGRYAIDRFDAATACACADRAVAMALTNLDAVAAIGGEMSVVLAPGYPGVLFHEAVGHGLEGDFLRKRSSAFCGMVGERVAAKGVTVIDDGGIAEARGSLNVDDEGELPERTVLIEDGILTGFMQDRANARLSNTRPTGNGRRQSSAHLPMPRMTNTFLAAGDRDPQEIIASVKRGIYAVEFGGGQVDIASGRFSFSAQLAFLIEDGRIKGPVKGATLIGEGARSLRGIAMVGTDFALDPGSAVCGKAGQTVPVSVGQPTLRIDNMVVGAA